MLIYLTEVTITDNPEYQVLYGVPVAMQKRAIEKVKSALVDEMMDEYGEEYYKIITTQVSGNQISITYEGCLNTYYITAHAVE